MRIMHQEIKLDIEWLKNKTKEYYDKRRMETPTLEEGDRVYVRRRTSGEKISLPPRMRIHPIFHISLLDKTNNPVSTKGEDIINEFEVESILAKRRRKGVTEYLVLTKMRLIVFPSALS